MRTRANTVGTSSSRFFFIIRSRLNWVAFAAVVALGVVPGRAAAQVDNFRARLDSLFTILDTNQRMMGAITIRKADRILYQRTIGYRDSTQSGWVRSDSLTEFRVGSVTKPFTAVLVYQLVDERRLSLDTKVSQFLPQLASGDSITVRDLLGHTSGLTDYTHGMDPMVPLDREALLGRISTQPLQFLPGTRRRYSNSNYLLLGYIIEIVTGSTYEEQLERGIADRIGLRRTDVGGPVTPSANEARAYYFDRGHWEPQPDQAIENAGAAGGIASTSNDLSLFLAALFQGRLISAASLSEMTNGFDDGTRKSGKGLGPFAIPGSAKSGFSHDGSIGAHAALVGHVPEDSLSLALTVNGYNYPINRIFFLVWNILYGLDARLPSFTQVTLPDTTPLVGVYSADAYGLTITVRGNGVTLEAQTEGQDAFPLTYVGNNRFLFVPAGIMVDFDAPVGGVSPRFILYQQNAAIPLMRAP
jgi:D-alanyl-D-alanine carboxypeptidase